MQNERMVLSVEGDGVVLYLGSRDEPCTLYLTFDEASTLASGLREDLLSTQAEEDDIMVTDVVLERGEAQSLLSLVEVMLAVEENTIDSHDDRDDGDFAVEMRRVGCDLGRVDWRSEGF